MTREVDGGFHETGKNGAHGFRGKSTFERVTQHY